MKLINFVIIKLTLCLIIGILLAHYTAIDLMPTLFCCILLLIILAIALVVTKQQYKQSFWFGILVYLTTICIGNLVAVVHEQSNFKNHYTSYENDNNDSIPIIKLSIREVLKPSLYHNKYVADISQLNGKTVYGKSLLNIEKDSSIQALEVDDIYIVKTEFKTINEPKNPHQFNYKNYLSKSYIYHQLYAKNNELLKVDSTKRTFFGYASLLRKRINNQLKTYSFSEDELSIINALLLGQRQDISKDIYDDYKEAGVIHILAVSGLHIGIVLLLLNYLFKPLDYLKKGNYLKIITILTLLWSYAVLAGLSASIVRAVTMFSIVAIAMHIKRPTNVFNTLAISMFILLLFKPNFIFDVGFQLSYLAVFAIVIIQPILYKLWIPKSRVINFFWNIFTVTLAAQIGVIPISLFYFHQFPGLFFISNLVIIPCLGIILGFGFIVIILSLLNILPVFIANAYGWIIYLMNSFVGWVSNQEVFLLKNIAFGLDKMLLSYLLITMIIIFVKQKTFKSIVSVLATIMLFQGYLIFEKYDSKANDFFVFHKSRHTVLGIKKDRQLQLHHNLKTIENENILTNFIVGEGVNTVKYDSIEHVYSFHNKKLLIIDSLGVYNLKSLEPNIILLRNSPKINLTRLIDSLSPELIISDGSNYKTYQERWSATCEIKKIPFHQTDKKGAFVYSF